MFYPYLLVRYNHLNDGCYLFFKIYSKILNNEYIYNRLSKKKNEIKNIICFIDIFHLKLSELNFSGPTVRIRAPKRNTKQKTK